MKLRILFFTLTSFLVCFIHAQNSSNDSILKTIDLTKIEAEKNIIRYDLNRIIETVEDSIKSSFRVVVPKDANEFEKALFTARRVQHNDSQLIAVKLFRYLLEFKCYRTIGEKLYIQYLLANSLNYLGSPILANSYFNQTFPDLLDYLDNTARQSYFLSHYGRILINIDSLERAKQVYFDILQLNKKVADEAWICSAQNNYAYVLGLSGDLDSAVYYYRLNQDIKYKKYKPIIHAFSFGNYASVLQVQKQYDSSIWYYKREIKLLDEIPSDEGRIHSLFSLGKTYNLKGQKDSAIAYLNKALKLAIVENQISTLVKIYEKLIELQRGKNIDPELSDLIVNYIKLNDTLRKNENTKSTEAEVQVTKFLEINNEAQLFKQEHDELVRSHLEQYYIIIILGILLVALIGLLLFKRSGRKKLAQKNAILRQKNGALFESYKEISESNLKNQTLLKELHHRVKNNLQIISSLFNLQINAQKMDEKSKEVFRDAQDRIHSISLVHKQIYQSDNFTHLDFAEYLHVFTNESISMNVLEFDIKIELEPCLLSIDIALPLGLIFNELFVNSIKHAGASEKLKIRIYQEQLDKQIRFVYTDNGPGIKLSSIELENENSIGITLIRILSSQLNLNIEFKEAQENQYGFYFHIDGVKPA